MRIETVPYDPAEFLIDEETISRYLTLALRSQDPRVIANALAAVARARGGIDRLAVETGISAEALSRALSAGENADFGIVLKVMDALGVRLSATMVA